MLLRLSPLLPLALSNYLYGLTSVDLTSYVLGSWAGMLPGTIAYVAAGACVLRACSFMQDPVPADLEGGVAPLAWLQPLWQRAEP